MPKKQSNIQITFYYYTKTFKHATKKIKQQAMIKKSQIFIKFSTNPSFFSIRLIAPRNRVRVGRGENERE